MNGTFPLARRILESPVWEQGALTVQIWLWLLLNAVWEEEGRTMPDGRHLHRGQVRTSYPEIAEAMRYRHGKGYRTPPVSTIKSIIGRLLVDRTGDRMIDLTGDRNGLVITVCNYDRYNSPEFIGRPIGRPVDRPVGRQLVDRHAPEHCSRKLESTLSPRAPADTNKREAQVTYSRDDTTPLELEETHFLEPEPNFDLAGLMKHFRALKKQHKRRRLDDLRVENMLRRLHCDPDIRPRLGTEELRMVLSNWLKWGRPLRPEQMWALNPHLQVPWWEACLDGAEREERGGESNGSSNGAGAGQGRGSRPSEEERWQEVQALVEQQQRKREGRHAQAE